MSKPTPDVPTLHDELAEVAVLGAVLSDRDAWALLQGRVEGSDFYGESRRLIWRACERLAAQGKPLRYVTLHEQLRATGDLQRAGGLAGLRGIIAAANPAADAVYYARSVRLWSVVRSIRDTARAVQAECESPSIASDEGAGLANRAHAQLSEAVALLNHAKPRGGALGRTNLLASVRQALEDIDAAERGVAAAPSTIPFGLPSLDAKAQCPVADLTALAGDPESGKSSLLKRFLTNWAHAGRRPGIVLIEDRLAHYRNRVLAEELGIEVRHVRRVIEGDRTVDAATRKRVAEALARWLGGQSSMPEWDCYEGAAMTVEQVAMEARRLVAAGCGVIAVDTFSRIKLPRWSNASRLEKVNHNVDTLAELGPELGVPVVVTVHLSRAHRKEKRQPTMSDLRDTGQWEQSARLVLIANRGVIDVAKANHDATGLVDLAFDGPTTTWRERDQRDTYTSAGSGETPV